MGLSFVGEANFQSCDSLTFYRNDFTHLPVFIRKIRTRVHTFPLVPTRACSSTFERRKHTTKQCLSCTIRRTTLQVIRQYWIGGWSAFVFAPPAGCTDQCSRIIFQCPENLQSNNCWQMSMNMTSEYTPLWDESELQRESVSAPPWTPIQYAIAQRTNLFFAFGIPIPGGNKLKKSVCKYGLSRAWVNHDWVSKHLKSRSAPGFDEAQSIDHKDGGGILQAWKPEPLLALLATVTVGVFITILHGS